MKVLVVCRPVAGADQSAFVALVTPERAALQELKARGTLVEAWSPGGRPGAVLVVEVADVEEARWVAGELPLVAAGLITTELTSLVQIDL